MERLNPELDMNQEAAYELQKKHWDNQPTTPSGMFDCHDKDGSLHEIDINFSVRVFNEHEHLLSSKAIALDIGAGIGRVTEAILGMVFDEIDILDQSPVQIEAAKKNVDYASNFYCVGLQDHKFGDKHYNCIWIQ